MKVPNVLKVGGVQYKVEYPYTFKERSDLCGQHRPSQTIIRLTDIDGSGHLQSWESIRDTFFHEIVHAIVWQYHGEKDIDEQLVCALAHGIVQVLNDNDLTVLFEKN